MISKLLGSKLGILGMTIMGSVVSLGIEKVIVPEVKEIHDTALERKHINNIQSTPETTHIASSDSTSASDTVSMQRDHWWDYLLWGTHDFKENAIRTAYMRMKEGKVTSYDIFWYYYDTFWYHLHKSSAIETVSVDHKQVVIDAESTQTTIWDRFLENVSILVTERTAYFLNEIIIMVSNILLNEYILFFLVFTLLLLVIRIALWEITIIIRIFAQVKIIVKGLLELFK
jgi:hypothetical protein